MGQSKLGSMIEAISNTAVGFIISLFAQTWYLLYFDIQISHAQNAGLVAFMTLISIVRGYVLRRFFNGRAK